MAKSTTPELFIGTSGYSYADWRGVVYPKSVKREVGGSTPELTYLSRYFNTCEINATFYRHFEPAIAKKWSDAVESPGFEFAIKANQVFTHAAGSKPSQRKAPTSVQSLKYSQTDIDQSREFLDVLVERKRLLVVLFQFPVSFKFTTKNKEGEAVRLEGNWDHVADVLMSGIAMMMGLLSLGQSGRCSAPQIWDRVSVGEQQANMPQWHLWIRFASEAPPFRDDGCFFQ
jgi:hypothetical protein